MRARDVRWTSAIHRRSWPAGIGYNARCGLGAHGLAARPGGNASPKAYTKPAVACRTRGQMHKHTAVNARRLISTPWQAALRQLGETGARGQKSMKSGFSAARRCAISQSMLGRSRAEINAWLSDGLKPIQLNQTCRGQQTARAFFQCAVALHRSATSSPGAPG